MKILKNLFNYNRAIQRINQYLLQANLFAEIKKVKGRDEIELSMVMPQKFIDGRGREEYRQNHSQEKEVFTVGIKQLLDVIVTRPEKKFYDKIRRQDIIKILYYLRYAKNEFLPGLPVIKNLPVERIQNFYINNNNKRYGQLIQKVGFDNEDDQEGLFKLSYMLGLFSDSVKDSERAFEFILNNVMKNIDPQNIHKYYGGINLKENIDLKFAEFFMIQFANNPEAFKNDEGIDKTDLIYSNFEIILKNRPEKEIKTTTNRERLTMEDCFAIVTNGVLMLGYSEDVADKVNVIAKYTLDRNEIDWALAMLKKGEEIKTEDLKIPYVEDQENSKFKFRILKKGDPEIAITGRKTNCCFRYKGASYSSIEHAMISPNSTVVVFESPKSYVQGWLWYDEQNKLLVIDNLEGYPEFDDNKNTCNEFMNAVLRFADNALLEMRKMGLPCDSVNLGTGYLNERINSQLKSAIKEENIIKCEESILDYPHQNNLYTDAGNQLILTNDDLIKKHTKIYENQQELN